MGIKALEVGEENNEEPKTSEPSLKEIMPDESQALESLNLVLNDSMNLWNEQIRELQSKTVDLMATLKLLIKLSSENQDPNSEGERIDATAKDLLVDHLLAQVQKENQKILPKEGDYAGNLTSDVETSIKRMVQLLTRQIN